MIQREGAKRQRCKGRMDENRVSYHIISAAIEVHKTLGGPGLLESVYEEALAYELNTESLKCERQKDIPVGYRDIRLNIGFRADIIVEDKVLIELKSVDKLLPIHHKQVLTYLKLCNLKLGLLINFNTLLIKDGIKRIVNGL